MSLVKVQSRGTENVGGGNRNIVINGAMRVAQRSTSQTGITYNANEGYTTVDRFAFDGGGHGGVLTATQSTDAPTGFSNSLKMDCTTADASPSSSTATPALLQNKSIALCFLYISFIVFSTSMSLPTSH